MKNTNGDFEEKERETELVNISRECEALIFFDVIFLECALFKTQEIITTIS